MQKNKSLIFYFLVVLVPLLFCGLRFSEATVLPTNVTVINKEGWLKAGYFSVADALRGLTAFNIERQGFHLTNGQIKLRGTSNSARVVVLLDGRPLTHDNDSHIDLSQIPLSMLERIEIVEGGAPGAYSAEGVAGTIHLITQRPKEKGLDTNLGTTIGRFGTKSVLGQFLGRSYWGDISYLASKDVTGGFMNNEQAESNNHFVNISRSFNGKGFWGLEYFYHEAEIEQPNGTAVPFEKWDRHAEKIPADPTGLRQEKRQHGKVYLSLPTKHAGELNLTWTETFQDSDSKPGRNQVSIRDEDSHSRFVDLKYDIRHVQMGASYKQDREKIAPGETNTLSREGFFVARTWTGSEWSFAPSARLDHESQIGSFFSPRLTVIHTPTSKLTFSSSITRSFRSPTFEELFLSSTAIPNPDLDAERSWSYDFGIQISDKHRTSLKLVGFYTAIDDVIQVNSVTDQWNNSGREKNYGSETTATLPLGKPFLLTGQWIYQRSAINSNNGLGYQRSAMTPMHLLLTKLTWTFSGGSSLINEVRAKSKQYSQNGETGLTVPQFAVWNTRFEMRILKADLFLSVDNILNRRYAEALANPSAISGVNGPVLSPQADRMYSAGIMIRFLN